MDFPITATLVSRFYLQLRAAGQQGIVGAAEPGSGRIAVTLSETNRFAESNLLRTLNTRSVYFDDDDQG